MIVMKYCSKQKIKIKRSTLNRIAKFAICLGLLFIISVLYTPLGGVKGVSVLQTSEYTIQQGDDLWSIAEKINSKNMDTREVVYEIKHLNKMDDLSLIKAGQQLILPVY